MILYLRVVPGFGVAIEERDRPAWHARPLVLSDSGRVVDEANGQALRNGIRPGMPLAQARHQCPDLLLRASDLPRYELAWADLLELLRRYTPLVAPMQLGQAACDLTGCERLWGSMIGAAQAMSGEIERQIGVFSWLGLASNLVTAQIASRFAADGPVLVARGQERAFLAELPLTVLPEVGTRLALTFRLLGLHTIGQLAALPPAAVQERFGQAGKRLHRYARGIDPRPVTPPPASPTVTVRRQCEDGSPSGVLADLQHLVGAGAEELARRALAGRLVRLTLIYEPERRPERADREAGSRPAPLPGPPPPPLTLPARLHSRLPQPSKPRQEEGHFFLPPATRPAYQPTLPGRRSGHTLVRTPITAAAPLWEQGQRLLQRLWQEGREPLALELTVAEFEAPRQLSFLGLGRAERAPLLLEQERALAARYGASPFRHLDQFDPASALAERRFHWAEGLERRRA